MVKRYIKNLLYDIWKTIIPQLIMSSEVERGTVIKLFDVEISETHREYMCEGYKDFILKQVDVIGTKLKRKFLKRKIWGRKNG